MTKIIEKLINRNQSTHSRNCQINWIVTQMKKYQCPINMLIKYSILLPIRETRSLPFQPSIKKKNSCLQAHMMGTFGQVRFVFSDDPVLCQVT